LALMNQCRLINIIIIAGIIVPRCLLELSRSNSGDTALSKLDIYNNNWRIAIAVSLLP